MLTELLEGGANVVEYYFHKLWPDEIGTLITEFMPDNTEVTQTKFTEFVYRHLYYTYDCADDGQRVYKRHLVSKQPLTSFYAYKEETLAAQQFPCTQEITLKKEMSRVSWRINHRLFLNLEHEMTDDYNTQANYIYLRYNHSVNMDTKKIESDFAHWVGRIGNHLEKSGL